MLFEGASEKFAHEFEVSEGESLIIYIFVTMVDSLYVYYIGLCLSLRVFLKYINYRYCT
jgi:hypothetical protein